MYSGQPGVAAFDRQSTHVTRVEWGAPPSDLVEKGKINPSYGSTAIRRTINRASSATSSLCASSGRNSQRCCRSCNSRRLNSVCSRSASIRLSPFPQRIDKVSQCGTIRQPTIQRNLARQARLETGPAGRTPLPPTIRKLGLHDQAPRSFPATEVGNPDRLAVKRVPAKADYDRLRLGSESCSDGRGTNGTGVRKSSPTPRRSTISTLRPSI